MVSSESQIDKPQYGRPKRAELPDVNINTSAQSINTERASQVDSPTPLNTTYCDPLIPYLLIHKWKIILQLLVTGDQNSFSLRVVLRSSCSTQHLQNIESTKFHPATLVWTVDLWTRVITWNTFLRHLCLFWPIPDKSSAKTAVIQQLQRLFVSFLQLYVYCSPSSLIRLSISQTFKATVQPRLVTLCMALYIPGYLWWWPYVPASSHPKPELLWKPTLGYVCLQTDLQPMSCPPLTCPHDE